MGKNDHITMTEAIARAVEHKPTVSPSALREAVRNGEIPSERSSKKPLARYFVRWSDVKNWLDN